MKTIESLIEEANQRGLFMNNLFQLHDQHGTPWQANFRTATPDFFEFGRGPTAAEAIIDALQKSRGVMMHPKPAPKAPVDPFS